MPTFLVSQLAAEHVKVVLTGDGGDEAFGGYDRHRALLLAERLARPAAAPLRGALALAEGLVSLGGAGGHRSLSTRLGRFRTALQASPWRRNDLWRRVAPPADIDALLSADGRRRLGRPVRYGPDESAPFGLNDALVLDAERYLPDDLLVKLDIASMAHSLEARSPFLDRDLMEFAASLPVSYKVGRRQGKRVLRAAAARRLPPDVLDGPKRGFGIPLDRWFRGRLGGHAREVLLSPRARQRGLFDPVAVGRLLDDHAAGTVAAHELLFTLLVLERWFLAEETRR